MARTNPLAWLRYGPGRERAGEPGWTESREVTAPEPELHADKEDTAALARMILEDPELADKAQDFLTALETAQRRLEGQKGGS